MENYNYKNNKYDEDAIERWFIAILLFLAIFLFSASLYLIINADTILGICPPNSALQLE